MHKSKIAADKSAFTQYGYQDHLLLVGELVCSFAGNIPKQLRNEATRGQWDLWTTNRGGSLLYAPCHHLLYTH